MVVANYHTNAAPAAATALAVGVAVGAVSMAAGEFVALEPGDYRDHFVEGWPGPNDDGTGAGVVSGCIEQPREK